MNGITKSLSLVTLLGVAAAANAQTTTQVSRPWKVELGAYIPNNIGGIDEKVGGTFGLGYTVARLQDKYDLEVELRGNSFQGEDALSSGTLTISQFNVNAYFRTAENPIFFGLGLGLGRGTVEIDGFSVNDDPRFVYNVAVGYSFQPNLYAIARYHGGTEEYLRGISVGVGYRF